jgi:hypothetical protein
MQRNAPPPSSTVNSDAARVVSAPSPHRDIGRDVRLRRVHLIGAFRNYSGFCDLCDCASGLPKSFVPIALSLPVAIFAMGGLHCLSRQIETIDLEMQTATLDLLNNLARLPPRN